MLHTPAHAELRVLARTGDALPGSTGTLSNFQRPVLRRPGEPILAASLSTTTDTRAVLIRIGPTRGQGRVLVAEGDPSPDANGNFSSTFIPSASLNGAVTFQQSLQNALSNPSAIFTGGAGSSSVSIAVRQGDPLPSSGGSALIFLTPNPVADNGSLAFGAFTAPMFNSGIWSWSQTNGLQRVFVSSALVPGGGNFQVISGRAVRFNELGSASFFVGVSLELALLRRTTAGIVQVARQNSPVPGGNGIYSTINDHRLNDLNNLAWLSGFSNTSGGTADDLGILLNQTGGTNVVVRKGAFVPDGNGRYLDFGDNQGICFNNRNEILFFSSITGASNGSSQGIFLQQASGTLQLARRNQPAPDGGNYTMLVDLIGLNRNGVAIFSARTQLTPQSTERLGIFEYRQGMVRKIIAVGDTIPGFGLVKGLSYAVDTAPGSTPLNDADQFAFIFSVNSTQHVALWDPTPPPPDHIMRSGFEASTP